jgi:hypothetical protein
MWWGDREGGGGPSRVSSDGLVVVGPSISSEGRLVGDKIPPSRISGEGEVVVVVMVGGGDW